MACGARSGFKPRTREPITRKSLPWLNGLWSPFGIETLLMAAIALSTHSRLNGLWSPFGIETPVSYYPQLPQRKAKWPVEPVRDSCENMGQGEICGKKA